MNANKTPKTPNTPKIHVMVSTGTEPGALPVTVIHAADATVTVKQAKRADGAEDKAVLVAVDGTDGDAIRVPALTIHKARAAKKLIADYTTLAELPLALALCRDAGLIAEGVGAQDVTPALAPEVTVALEPTDDLDVEAPKAPKARKAAETVEVTVQPDDGEPTSFTARSLAAAVAYAEAEMEAKTVTVFHRCGDAFVSDTFNVANGTWEEGCFADSHRKGTDNARSRTVLLAELCGLGGGASRDEIKAALADQDLAMTDGALESLLWDLIHGYAPRAGGKRVPMRILLTAEGRGQYRVFRYAGKNPAYATEARDRAMVTA